MNEVIIVVAIALLVLNICMIVKFFQMAKNIERLTDLYVNGKKEIYNTSVMKYYKLPLEELDASEYNEESQKTKKEEEPERDITSLTIYGLKKS
jgi:tRNA isopentenyl-2-thiomethyl-A-37 hydroxylase MiaE